MLTGVILAGGQSRRMGGNNKAFLSFSNETLVQRQIRMMKQICSELILVTNEPKAFLPSLRDSVRIITDFIPGNGPLSGMHAAFTLSKYSDLWVVGCDMPFISTQAAQLLWMRKKHLKCDGVIPFINHKFHPLHGIYDKSCSPMISELLDLEEFRLQNLLHRIRFDTVHETYFSEQGIHLNFVTNVNTPEDYKEALRYLSTSHEC